MNQQDAALFAGFQNLGDNCEFASAQEQAGLKRPLTLLSYASTTGTALRAALRTRFAGVGDPARTRLDWHPGWSEYRLTAEPWFRLHARIFRPFATRDEHTSATRDAAAMLGLLRRRLLADMADPARIFVFKTADPAFDARAFHTAFRASARAALLCVTIARAPAEVGAIEILGDGLYLGRIDRFGSFPAHRPWIGSYDVWRALCAGARAHRDAYPAG